MINPVKIKPEERIAMVEMVLRSGYLIRQLIAENLDAFDDYKVSENNAIMAWAQIGRLPSFEWISHYWPGGGKKRRHKTLPCRLFLITGNRQASTPMVTDNGTHTEIILVIVNRDIELYLQQIMEAFEDYYAE